MLPDLIAVFGFGLFIGGGVGFCVASLIQIKKEDDRDEDDFGSRKETWKSR